MTFGFGALPLNRGQFVAQQAAFLPEHFRLDCLSGPHGLAHLLGQDLYPPPQVLGLAGHPAVLDVQSGGSLDVSRRHPLTSQGDLGGVEVNPEATNVDHLVEANR